MKRLKNLNERRPRKKGYFLCKRKIISKSVGKQARTESLHGKIYRDKKPADPAVPQRAMIFLFLTGVCLGCWMEQWRGKAVSTDIKWTIQHSMSGSGCP